jgi:hypothetical protein
MGGLNYMLTFAPAGGVGVALLDADRFSNNPSMATSIPCVGR